MQQEDRPAPRFELIDGDLIVTPSPQPAHQFVLSELFAVLSSYLRGNKEVRLLASPADIRLEPESIVQPDLFVAQRPTAAVRAWSDIKSLVLAIEVLSPSTARTDRTTKRRFYQRHTVSEYWVVDTDNRRIERWHPAESEATICADRLEWHAPGSPEPLVLDVAGVFREALRP